MVIRRIVPGEEHLIQICVKEVYEEYNFTWDEAGYHQDLYRPDDFYPAPGGFWIALDNSEREVLGCCALRIFAEPIEGDRIAELSELCRVNNKIRIASADCELNRLYVRPQARKVGAGSALTQAIIDAAKFNGKHKMEIWSDKAFVDAHRLYQRFGAKVVGERVCEDPDESPEWGLAIDFD